MPSPTLAVAVVAGGIVGAAAREAVEQALPPPTSGFPVATLLINLAGAFVLGVLLEALARSGQDDGWRRRVRLAGGTGFLGGFTTYSTFAVEAVQVVRHGHTAMAAVYIIVTVAGGLVMAAAGVVVGARGSAWRVGRRVAVDPDL